MAYCANCGAPVEGRFCSKCGKAVDNGTPNPSQAYAAGGTGGMSENTAAGLSYVLGFITGVLFLVLAPYNQNRFVRFHAFQSIFLTLAWLGFWICFGMFGWILPWPMYGMLSGVAGLISLAFFVLWVFCLIKAFSHEKFMIPVIGELADKQA